MASELQWKEFEYAYILSNNTTNTVHVNESSCAYSAVLILYYVLTVHFNFIKYCDQQGTHCQTVYICFVQRPVLAYQFHNWGTALTDRYHFMDTHKLKCLSCVTTYFHRHAHHPTKSVVFI